MRSLSFAVVILVAGCHPTSAPVDLPPPLVGAEERPLVTQTVPGEPAGSWPASVAYANGRYLVPYHATDGLHALVVDGSGTSDVALGPGSLVGVTAHGDELVAVTSSAGTPTVHFVDGSGDHPRVLAGAGVPATGVASDGKYVLVLVNAGGGVVTGQQATYASMHALLVGKDAFEMDLGSIATGASVWGDAHGFIVDGRLLFDENGSRAYAPAAQLDGARLFHDPSVAADRLTLDGKSWLRLDAPAGWATAVDGGFVVALPDGSGDGLGQRLVRVGADLTSAGEPVEVPRSSTVPGWVRALRGDRALWEALDGNDHLFAVLDATSLAGQGSFVRVHDASSRTVTVALGETNVLLAFVAQDGSFEISLYDR